MMERFDRMALRLAVVVGALVLIFLLPIVAAHAYTVGEPVRLSPAGHNVGEVSIETSPTNPQAMIANTIDNNRRGNTLIDQIRCAMYNSQDGGRTWTEVPAWPEMSAQNRSIHDPWVAVGPDGTFHATCIWYMPNGTGQVAYIKSVDGGRTWTRPLIITPYAASAGADKSVIEVAHDGRLVVCFRQAGQVILSQSLNQGATWTTKPTGLNAQCNGITTAPPGYITLATVHGSSFQNYGTATSANNGATWGPIRTLGGATHIDDVQFPSMVRDSTGRNVIAGVNRSASGAVNRRLMVTMQADNGARLSRWQVPSPSSRTCSAGTLIHPQLSVVDARSPALQIMCKVQPTSTAAGQQEIWLYPAVNQPNNSAAPILVDRLDLPPQSPPPAGSLASRIPNGGYYWDFTWTSDGWFPVWIDPRPGKGIGPLYGAHVSNN